MKPADRITLAGFRLAWAAGARLPMAITRMAFGAVAEVALLLRTNSTRRLQFNQARVLQVPADSAAARQAAKAAMRNYFRYWAEMFAMSRFSIEELHRFVVVRGLEQVDAIRESGRGLLLVGTHSGNWDAAGAWGATHFHGVVTVAERLEPVELFDEFVKARTRFELEILPHRGGERPPVVVLQERLAAGRVVALASDRDLSRRGVPVDLLGHPTRMPSGPARLCAATGAALVPVAVFYEGANVVCDFLPEIETLDRDEQQITQAMADAFGGIVRRHPESWFMLQQLWLDHPVEWGGRG